MWTGYCFYDKADLGDWRMLGMVKEGSRGPRWNRPRSTREVVLESDKIRELYWSLAPEQRYAKPTMLYFSARLFTKLMFENVHSLSLQR